MVIDTYLQVTNFFFTDCRCTIVRLVTDAAAAAVLPELPDARRQWRLPGAHSRQVIQRYRRRLLLLEQSIYTKDQVNPKSALFVLPM